MKFTFMHNNINVLDLEKSIAFYKEALGLEVARQMEAADGRFKIVFLSDGATAHQLELTWLRDQTEPYDLGDNEIHLAMLVDDYEAALKNTKRWAASALKTRRWASISSRTRTAIGRRSSRNADKNRRPKGRRRFTQYARSVNTGSRAFL